MPHLGPKPERCGRVIPTAWTHDPAILGCPRSVSGTEDLGKRQTMAENTVKKFVVVRVGEGRKVSSAARVRAICYQLV